MTVHVTVPVQDEVEHLPACIDALRSQQGLRPVLWFCVNQPEDWWQDPTRRSVCDANRICLELLGRITDLPIRILDRSSPGQGWPAGRVGVGQARRELMDAVCGEAANEDLLVSLDADTTMPSNYLQSLVDAFARHPSACAIAARYLHPLAGDERVSRAMLGYEIYMRLYVLNLWRIGSPFSFTALGSAIALPTRVYRQVGGITPRATGEDFYFLQKLVKLGRVLHWSDAVVAPSSRTSERVPVGTGQAILAACRGEHRDRYPLYPAELFDEVQRATSRFADLYAGDLECTALDGFLQAQLKTADLWQPLRDNNRTRARFVRACHERLDGLRILQYVKSEYRRSPSDDSTALADWLLRFGGEMPGMQSEASHWESELRRRSLEQTPTAGLERIRRMLFRMEDRYREQDFLDA